MKALNKLWVVSLLTIAAMLFMPPKTKAQYGEISFQAFYDDLAPYGTWIDDPEYGDAWVPDAGPDFRPYATNGHWAVTSYGNTWVSDYEWGWAPFHYGRWHFDDYYGWIWVPDYEWVPAWVSWRTGGDYYGWAPLAPGISIDVAIGGYSVPDIYWVFAPRAYITSPYIYNYYVPRPRVVNIIRNTTIIRNVYVNNSRRYVSGPAVRDMQRYTRNRVNVYNINNVNRPGASHIRNNTVNIYRPAVRHDDHARPQRVIDARAYRNANPNERITTNHQNAQRLANYARTTKPDNKIVHENRHPASPAANNRTPAVTPAPAEHNTGRAPRTNVPRTDRQPTPVNRPGQPVQHDRNTSHGQQAQQRQQQEAQRQNVERQQRDQQRQQAERQQAQQRPQQEAQRQNVERQQRDQQRQQAERQQAQQRQQQEAQRQNVERQQRDQQRQQQQQEQQQHQQHGRHNGPRG